MARKRAKMRFELRRLPLLKRARVQYQPQRNADLGGYRPPRGENISPVDWDVSERAVARLTESCDLCWFLYTIQRLSLASLPFQWALLRDNMWTLNINKALAKKIGFQSFISNCDIHCESSFCDRHEIVLHFTGLASSMSSASSNTRWETCLNNIATTIS